MNLMANPGTNTGESPNWCELCQKRFVSIKLHMKAHTGVKPYSCQLCQKSFADNSNIKRHMRTHTGEKPHRCQLCQKAFADRSTLRKHKQGCEKAHRCQLCHKSFGNLKLHMIIHSGEYPHRCQICQKSFAQISTLQAHMRAQLCKKQANVVISRNGGETHPFNRGYSHNTPYTMSISSDQKSELDAGTQPENLEMRSEVTPDQSNQFVTFSSGYVADENIGRFSQDIYPDSGGISGLSWRRGDGECLHISKIKSLADAKVSLSKCFGCGICDELVETQKELLEHCSRHRLSQPVDLFTDKCCIMFPHD